MDCKQRVDSEENVSKLVRARQVKRQRSFALKYRGRRLDIYNSTSKNAQTDGGPLNTFSTPCKSYIMVESYLAMLNLTTVLISTQS